MSSASRRVSVRFILGCGIKQRERKHFWPEAEFPGDDLKWWGIGDLPALVWLNGMTRHTAGLRQTLAVIGVSGERRWRKQDC